MSTFTKSTFTRKGLSTGPASSPGALSPTNNNILIQQDAQGVHRSIYHGQALVSSGLAEVDGTQRPFPIAHLCQNFISFYYNLIGFCARNTHWPQFCPYALPPSLSIVKAYIIIFNINGIYDGLKI